MNREKLFKSYLRQAVDGYKGGISRDQLECKNKIYKLSSNENILGPSPKAIESMVNAMSTIHEYPDPTGKEMSISLSEFYHHDLSPDQFITSNSGVGVIELIVRAFLGPGLETIVTNPTFTAYIDFSRKEGAEVIDVPLVGDDFSLNVEGVLDAITSKTRVIWLCSPSNPTGTHIPKDKVEYLLQNIPDHVIVVYDEVYRQFVTADDYITGESWVHKGYPLIAINSFSKAYGLAGVRIGYAYTTEEIARYVNKLRRPFLLHSLGIAAAKGAMADWDFLHKTVEMVKAGKEYLYPKLEELGLRFWKSQTNFILVAPEMDTNDFTLALQNEGIMVRPAQGFGAPGCVRVTIGDQEANEAYIKALKKVYQPVKA